MQVQKMKQVFIPKAPHDDLPIPANTVKINLQVPTGKDWGDLTIDPEVGCAYRLYGRKTIDEAMPLFIENPIERSAELRYAPRGVFNYYLFCFVEFLL